MSREISLTRGFAVIVDDSDYEAVVNAGPWRPFVRPGRRVVYAMRYVRLSEARYMHQFLTGWPQTDHRNGDGLDNRRANLRPATDTQNRANCGPYSNNRSGFKGVSLRSDRGNRWRATIRAGGRQFHLGHYNDIEAAARAYDRAALEMFGEFARLNFPGEV